jgi:preprotein translocase subunit SecB
MNNINESHSALILHEVFIENLLFERKDYTIKRVDIDNTKINFKRSIDDMGNNKYKVKLSINMISENEFDIETCICGIFEFEGDKDFGSKLLSHNSVAILFPYLRSQITILTSQPGFEPIVLPVININRLLDEK